MTRRNKSNRRGNGRLKRLETRLLEAYDEMWDDFVDPREAFFDSEGTRWLALGAHGGDAGQYAAAAAFDNEQTLGEIRDHCRWLALTNEFAINGHENRVSYIVGAGHTYRAVGCKGREAPGALLARVQEVVDGFVRDNQWHRRQQEIVLRRDRDGEVFLRLFVGVGGATRVRFVEPAQVSTPQALAHDPAARFGIQTEPDDVETVLAYYVDGEPIEPAEVQHRKANVDANQKRGLPLFYPVRKNLRRAEKLLRNMSVVSEIQSAIAIIRKHHSSSRTAVQQLAAGQADVSVTRAGTGKTTHFRRYAPGTILDSSGGIEYDFPAAGLNAGSYVTVLQAELRAIASRLVMPEFMLTSDASNAAYASTMVAEGPAVKMFERLQAQQVADDLELMWRVVQAAIGAGRLPAEVRQIVQIQAAGPSLAVRDVLKEAHVAKIEFSAGVLSPQTWSLRRGLDYDQEQANLAEHRERSSLQVGSTRPESG
ncbi:MAG: phage portal protein [Pirellulales bacterium]